MLYVLTPCFFFFFSFFFQVNAPSYTAGWDYRARPWVPMGHGRPINPGPRGGVGRQDRHCPELRTWAARQCSSLPPPTEIVNFFYYSR